MPAISAAEAISPAIQRTKFLLFRPFSFGTYFKLCLVALLTEGSSGNFNSSFPKGPSSHRSGLDASHLALPHFALTPGRIAAGIAIVALLLILGLFISWLITRLRFAWFYCLITNTRLIRPGWSLYCDPATRFFWLSVIVGLCFLALIIALALPFAAGFLGLFRSLRAGGHPGIGAIFALLLPLLPLILGIVLLGVAVKIILFDFMLPHFALDNASTGQAWSAAWSRIRHEAGSFFLYALLRVLLPIAAGIGIFIVLLIPGIICALLVVAFGAALHAVLGHGALALFIEISLGSIAAAIGLLVVIGIYGPLQTAVREYALVFYGGRYRPLGDILYPPPPPPAIPAPLVP